MPGPAIRTDIIEVYIFRRRPTATHGGLIGLEFLQLRRARPPMVGGWHPVMGHVEPGETATQAALRELGEETAYSPSRGLIGFWQLELVNTYFLASIDAVMLSPGFAAEVVGPEAGLDAVIDDAHDAWRWVKRDQTDRAFLWPGQRAAANHIATDLLAAASPIAERLRLPL